MNGVEFALDLIEEYQEQPDGLQQLVESYVSSNLYFFFFFGFFV